MRYALGLLLGTFLLLAAGPSPLAAQPIQARVDSSASVISYSGKVLFKTWTGTSHQVSGTLAIDPQVPGKSRIALAAPVESFDSGNANRDSHMLAAVEASHYPQVRFTSTSIDGSEWDAVASAGTWTVSGALTFHGTTHPVTLPVEVSIENGRFQAEGTFEVSLTRYDVERPSLLMKRINDTIEMRFEIHAGLPLSASRTPGASESN